jgi:hypothetical protein
MLRRRRPWFDLANCIVSCIGVLGVIVPCWCNIIADSIIVYSVMARSAIVDSAIVDSRMLQFAAQSARKERKVVMFQAALG